MAYSFGLLRFETAKRVQTDRTQSPPCPRAAIMFDEESLNTIDFGTLMDALPPGLDLILVALPQMPGQRSSTVLPQIWKGDVYISNVNRMGWIKLPPLRQKGKIALARPRLRPARGIRRLDCADRSAAGFSGTDAGIKLDLFATSFAFQGF